MQTQLKKIKKRTLQEQSNLNKVLTKTQNGEKKNLKPRKRCNKETVNLFFINYNLNDCDIAENIAKYNPDKPQSLFTSLKSWILSNTLKFLLSVILILLIFLLLLFILVYLGVPNEWIFYIVKLLIKVLLL